VYRMVQSFLSLFDVLETAVHREVPRRGGGGDDGVSGPGRCKETLVGGGLWRVNMNDQHPHRPLFWETNYGTMIEFVLLIWLTPIFSSFNA